MTLQTLQITLKTLFHQSLLIDFIMNPHFKRKTLIAMVLSLSFFITHCSLSYESLEFSRGEKYLEKKNYKKAFSFYERIIKKNKDLKLVVQSAHRILHINSIEKSNPLISLEMLKILYDNEKNEKKKLEILYKISNIYFLETKNYEQAILVLSYMLKSNESYKHRKNLISSYIYTGNYQQALIEIKETSFRNILNKKEKFELENLKAQIYQALKKLKVVEGVYLRMIKNFSDLSYQYKIPLSLSIVYQEQSKINEAINILKTHSNLEDSFYKQRIQRLEIIKRNKPQKKRGR